MAETVLEAWYERNEAFVNDKRGLLVALADVYYNPQPSGPLAKITGIKTRQQGERALAKATGKTPRTIDRWFNWALQNGKQPREIKKQDDLERLAMMMPVTGGEYNGGLRKSKDKRNNKKCTLPSPKVTAPEAYRRLWRACAAQDDEGAFLAFWKGIYKMMPDELWDSDYTLDGGNV